MRDLTVAARIKLSVVMHCSQIVVCLRITRFLRLAFATSSLVRDYIPLYMGASIRDLSRYFVGRHPIIIDLSRTLKVEITVHNF